jgi:FimV-like protein
LVRKSDDVYVMQFQGAQPVTDGFVDLLIEFRWATGRAFRNIGFPLGTGQAPEPAVVANNDNPSPNFAPLPAEQPAAVTPPPRPAPMPTPPKEPVAKAESKPKPDTAVIDKRGATIQVVKGDTASDLVMTYASEGDVSLDQLLLSLLRNNPKAFVDNNVNRLKAGALISLPTEEDAASIDRKQARADIRLQALDFDAYRSQLASQTGKAKLADANEREAQGGLTAQVDNKAEKSPDQLKLSKPDAAEADQVKEKLQADQAAQRNHEVAKNVSELDSISQAAGKMQGGITSSLSNLPALAQDFLAWLKHYMFEVIAGIAVLAALLVSFSLFRDKNSSSSNNSQGEDPDLDFKSGPGPSSDKPQEMKIDFDLDLVPHTAPAPQASPAPASAFNASFSTNAPAASMGSVAPLSEDPFQVRLDLADELWKLGQRQTGRALAQEVADQTHGETRERALRWLQERT